MLLVMLMICAPRLMDNILLEDHLPAPARFMRLNELRKSLSNGVDEVFRRPFPFNEG